MKVGEVEHPTGFVDAELIDIHHRALTRGLRETMGKLRLRAAYVIGYLHWLQGAVEVLLHEADGGVSHVDPRIACGFIAPGPV